MIDLESRFRLDSYYDVVGYSVIGHDKEENQDSADVFYDGSQIIISVCDGLGSAVNSAYGSKAAVHAVVDAIKDRSDFSDSSELAQDIYERWSVQIPADRQTYDSTCRFICVREDSTYFGGIGDGLIAINTENGLIQDFAEHEFTNQTDSLESPVLAGSFRLSVVPTSIVKSMFISTDGFSEDLEEDSVKPFLDSMSQRIKDDSRGFMEFIRNFMTNEWPIDTNADDKTIVFVVRGNSDE